METVRVQTGSSSEPATSAAVAVGEPKNPLAMLLLITIAATVVVFFGFLKLYAGESIMVWAWKHWLPNLNQEYGKLVIPISLALVWYHRKAVFAAPGTGSNWGLAPLVAGLVVCLLGIRCVEPRITMLSIPFIIFGIVLFLWGYQIARILAFPIAFLWFMIPVGALAQTSFRLQFLITGAMQTLSPLIGVKLNIVGTTLSEVSGKWGFDIAEGCSGIRSLVAIIMLTAIYAHLSEKVLWKKIVLVACSVGFAIVANIGRVFTIILLARLGYANFAGGLYHEYSGYLLSFPFALGSMLLCHKLLNLGSKGSESDSSPQTTSPA